MLLKGSAMSELLRSLAAKHGVTGSRLYTNVLLVVLMHLIDPLGIICKEKGIISSFQVGIYLAKILPKLLKVT